MASQKWYISHAETLAQNIIGQVIAFLVLHLYGMDVETSLQIQVILFVTSYLRSYLIRRAFNAIGDKHESK